jgi:hypothetical protein
MGIMAARECPHDAAGLRLQVWSLVRGDNPHGVPPVLLRGVQGLILFRMTVQMHMQSITGA